MPLSFPHHSFVVSEILFNFVTLYSESVLLFPTDTSFLLTHIKFKVMGTAKKIIKVIIIVVETIDTVIDVISKKK